MARRPYIEPRKIRSDLKANAIGRGLAGHSKHVYNYQPVGSDGRYDWFRWNCRNCDRKYISMRAEKRMKYYRCLDCQTDHFVYKGFFSSDKPTKPLTQSEFDGDLCKAKLAYKGREDRATWFYGSPEHLQDKIQGEYWETVEPIRKV